MKQSENTHYAALLERFQSQLATLASVEKDLTEAVSAAAKLEAIIEKIGTPKFSDEAAIERLTKARIRLPLAQQAVTENTEALDGAMLDLRMLMSESVDVCADLITPAIESAIEKVVDGLAPFFRERARAAQVARDTDSMRKIIGCKRTFADAFRSAADCHDAERLRTYAAPFVRVLKEAGKPEPRFEQFVSERCALPAVLPAGA